MREDESRNAEDAPPAADVEETAPEPAPVELEAVPEATDAQEEDKNEAHFPYPKEYMAPQAGYVLKGSIFLDRRSHISARALRMSFCLEQPAD